MGITLKKLKLLETELMPRDAQLRNFTPLRDRLVASGQDAKAAYRKMIRSRRDDLAAQVTKLTPAPARLPATAIGPLRPGTSLLTLLIAPARIITGGGPWFGASDSAQIGRAQEGVNVIPHGNISTSGAISALGRFSNSVITFGGFLDASFEAAADTFDPNDTYVWLHNWNYLFFLPPAGPTLHAHLQFRGGRVRLPVPARRFRHPHVVCIHRRDREFRGRRCSRDFQRWFPVECRPDAAL